MTRFTLHHGDCLKVLQTLPPGSVDAIVCDPPAGIAFMGKDWDKDKGGRDAWIAWMQSVAQECLRVIKPGGHALVWALPRTSHWTGMAWENAGWEPRDKIVHLFGTGFPKSLDVSKAIDKSAGAKREVVGYSRGVGVEDNQGYGGIARGGVGIVQKGVDVPVTASATDEAKQWEGWGTALKPAVEDWWLMRKPLVGTVAGNVLKYGTGALNIDGCRIDTPKGWPPSKQYNAGFLAGGDKHTAVYQDTRNNPARNIGRWPANLMHDGSSEVVAGFPMNKDGIAVRRHGSSATPNPTSWDKPRIPMADLGYGGGGSASRFFYCTKASRRDREEGCEHLEAKSGAEAVDREEGSAGMDSPRAGASRTAGKVKNHHPTVKNTDLMRYLCRLVTPENGVVLDPFMGSGSTGKGALLEGFRFVGIDQDPEYVEIARARIEYALRNGGFVDEIAVKPAPKAGSSLKVLRRKASDDQIDLFAQPIAQESQEV